ncbi:MAG: hypothetical protein ACYDBH_02560 [Acidobacteriaceae bacterium]
MNQTDPVPVASYEVDVMGQSKEGLEAPEGAAYVPNPYSKFREVMIALGKNRQREMGTQSLCEIIMEYLDPAHLAGIENVGQENDPAPTLSIR